MRTGGCAFEGQRRRCLVAQCGVQCWCGRRGEDARRRTNIVLLKPKLLHLLQLLLHLLLNGKFFLISNCVECALFLGGLRMKRRLVLSLLIAFI